MASRRVALIAGATGLTGRHLLELLLAESRYSRIHAIVRKSSLAAQARLEEHIVDFDHLAPLPKVDDVFCCLGTTIGKAGSHAAFRKVDLDYVASLATAAKQSGARRFFVVSAMGANAKSAVFYNRVKGEMEQALQRIGFSELHIFQPSLLLGERRETRFGERFGILAFTAMAPLMRGPARKYRPIAASAVARAMVKAAWTGKAGTTRYPSDRIDSLGDVA